MEIMDGMSLDLELTNKEKLKAVFPECFSEDSLDIDKLLSLCGEYITKGNEKYKFEWKGKSECLQLAKRRSTGTLRPRQDESVNFDDTENIYIKGDNLEVLKLLQTSYYRQVKMIYIDPPYNTGNDFVYEDDFADPISRYKEVTAQTTKSNPETMGRYHTNWLNMMYPRLRLAANLLRDDGVIFISIDDNEVFNLKKICDEVFGEENYVAMFPRVTKKAGKSSEAIAKNHDYLLVYGKTQNIKFYLQTHTDEGFKFEDEYVETRGKYKLNQTLDYDSLQYSPSLDYPIEIDGETFYPGRSFEKYQDRKNGIYSRADWAWRWSKELFEFGYKNGFIVVKKYPNYSRIYTKTYQNVSIEKKANGFEIVGIERTKPLSTLEFVENHYSNDNAKKQLIELFEKAPFDYSKPMSLLKFLSSFATKNDDIILDFFSGSATTAHAVMQLNAEDGGNRKFICVQLPEVCDEKSEAYKAGYKTICDIGMERIRRAGKKILEEQDAQMKLGDEDKKPLDIGFKVFELDTSNLKTWDGTPVEENEQLQLLDRMNEMLHRVKPDRSDLDMVYEIMLKSGIPLTYRVDKVDIQGKPAYSVGDDCLLLVCLAENITPEMIEEMCDYAPAKLVIGKNCFDD
ncbi:MAG: site-specific DNA-methyltransferase, partial [Clostridia bacterium]|nr:site-specific DNA-methyltransferase [Clostridia bacterium]